MAKDEVLFGYALLDDTKNTVSIDDIDRPFTRLHKFYCPHCHNEMYATFGEVQLPHFRHNGDKCQHSKYLHDLAEHVFYEEYSKCLDNGWPFYLELRIPTPCNKACALKKHADCKEHYIQKTVDLTKEYTLISLETRVDIDDRYRRPDILLESLDDKQLWVEIWVTHETEEDKRKDCRIIEIKIDSENDLENIRQHRIVQSEGDNPSVRLFGIKNDGTDDLFENEESISNIKFPCDKYYCFESGIIGAARAGIIDDIITTKSLDLTYRIILRLNWMGSHNSNEGCEYEKITEDDLFLVCSRRCYSYKNNIPIKDKSFESLIVSEWKKADLIRPIPTQGNTHLPHHSYYVAHSRQEIQTPSIVDIYNSEWVDLGLPSGTLWAKDDVSAKLSFKDAYQSYGSNLPSKTNVEELDKHCIIKTDGSNHAFVITGPNGNSISFSCKERNKTYWINHYEADDSQIGQCFHIGPDNHLSINDTFSSSLVYIRLVRR